MLRVEGIEAGYGELPVLHGVSLTVERNEAVAIIGANGAGKSTLVRAICGLLPLRAGRIVHDGREIQQLPAHSRAQQGIAVVLENRRCSASSACASISSWPRRTARKRGSCRTAFRLRRRDRAVSVHARAPARRGGPAVGRRAADGGDRARIAAAPGTVDHGRTFHRALAKVVRDIVAVMARLREGGMSILLVEQNVMLGIASIRARLCDVARACRARNQAQRMGGVPQQRSAVARLSRRRAGRRRWISCAMT